MPPAPFHVFISYSHRDEKLREDLGTHLFTLQRQGVIHSWHDRKITAGSEWAGDIHANLNSADIILLLISANFLASDYCNDIELKRALERHQLREARVIPIILKPSDWATTSLGGLQALPINGKAVTTWSNRDQAFLAITQGIRQVALEMEAGRGKPGPQVSQTPAESARTSRLDPAVQPAGAGSSAGAGREPRMEMLEGPVRHDSHFYIPTAQENRCCEEIEKPGSLIRIKSPKGMGRASLIRRLLAYAASRGYRTVALNLEYANQKFFEDPDRFMQWFCSAVGKGLGLRIKTEDHWDDIFGANDNSRDYFEKYLLKSDSPRLVLAIDNFDILGRIYNKNRFLQQLRLNSEAFCEGLDHEAIARRPHQVCANPPSSPLLTILCRVASTLAPGQTASRYLAQLAQSGYHHLRHPGMAA